ncbi:hypothetical protein AWW72_15475 [Acinetobacter sp. NRRL B-65365]|uniref:hypothetical protein n=1 Tax=Acinetobacter sp. NRRL B-65365 TaxID=1785092 RepID=UPI0007A016AE|nr:hypothetical protein [Acinetobacter sp. NRRL B-65365]KYQ83148.1 hypothetical protein AWW72_15475 [Acinetobacter sp. NRRL B-65365]
MTEAQQNPQNETENTKAATTTGPRKRGPKPKNTADNAAGNNTESKLQNEQQGTEQSSGGISSSQSELQSSNGAVGNHSPDALNAQGEASNGDGAQSSFDQNKSNDSSSDNVNSGTENNLGQSPQDDGQGGEANQNQSSESSNATVNSRPENTPIQQTQNVQVINNENIVVQETAKAEVKPKNGLIVKVKNVGLKAVYEPHSKISIEPGDEGTIIECANHADLKSVLANIDQLNALGKKIKVVTDE